MSLFSTYARIPILHPLLLSTPFIYHSELSKLAHKDVLCYCCKRATFFPAPLDFAGIRIEESRFSLNSTCSASRRDGSINRPRKKVRRSKRSSLRKYTSGAAVISVFESVKSGHFHEVESIRLPITSLPAYALLTIVCFVSALLETRPSRTTHGEKSSSLPGQELIANPRTSRDSWPCRTVVALAPNFARSFRRTAAYDPQDNRTNLSLASRFSQSDGHIAEAVRIASRSLILKYSKPFDWSHDELSVAN